MNSFAKGMVLGLSAGFALAYGLSSPGNKEMPDRTEPHQDPVSLEEHLSVKGENVLLKRMLGQVEGRVVLIGPVNPKSRIQGKLVWDNAMQQGFLHVGGLESGGNYELLIKTKGGNELVVARKQLQAADPDHWQTQFRSPARILDFSAVEIRVTTDDNDKLVLARGNLPEN